MSYTAEQYAAAIARAQAAGDSEAVADLQERAKGAGTIGSQRPAATPPEGAKPFQRASGRGPVLAGAGDALLKTIFGVSGLFGGNSPETKAVLREMEAEKEADPEKGWRTGGEMGGNLLATAIPGGAAAKAIQGAKWLPRAIAPIAAAAGSGAATELATAPGQGDSWGEQMASKGEQALHAGAMGGALAGGAKVLGKTLGLTGMFKATPEAEQLFRQGINPSLQQGAAGKTGRVIGSLTSGVTDLKPRLRDEAANAVMRRATEGKVDFPEGTGENFMRGANDYVQGQYANLWDGKKINLSPTHREAVILKGSRVPSDMVGIDEARQAGGILRNRMGEAENNYRMNYETFNDKFRKPLSADAFSDKNSPEVTRRLSESRDLLDKIVTRKGLSKTERVRLEELNNLNFDTKRIEEATSGVNMGKEGVDINRLATAYTKMLNEGRAMGNTTYDDIVAPAARVIGNTPNQHMGRSLRQAAIRLGLPVGAAAAAGGMGPAAIAGAVPIGISLLGQTPKGAKYLLGQNEWQRKLAEELAARSGKIGGIVGSTLTDQEEY